jgi:Flp pilus assembly pilin Flp
MDTSVNDLMVKRPVDGIRTRLAGAVTKAVWRIRDRRGVTAAEYAILSVAIVIVVGIAATQLLDPTKGAYVYLANVLGQTQNDVYSGVSGTR